MFPSEMDSEPAVVVLREVELLRRPGWVEVVLDVDLLNVVMANRLSLGFEVFGHFASTLFCVRNIRISVSLQDCLAKFGVLGWRPSVLILQAISERPSLDCWTVLPLPDVGVLGY
jgi:hypothetical protein